MFNGFDTEETQTGWVLRLTLDKNGMKSWNTMVAKIDERGIPHSDADAKSPHGEAGSDKIVDYDPPYPKTVRKTN